MRTIVYVDGYNFYYGRLKHTPYKWLDLAKFFSEQVLTQKAPGAQLAQVKYFTAEIKTNFASRNEKAGHAQKQYHRALRAGGLVEIINGFYTAKRGRALKPDYW